MKKIKWHFFVFMTMAIGIAVVSFAFENAGIKIEDVEEVADYDLATPDPDMLDADDAIETFSNDMAVCHADNANTIELATPDPDMLDAGEATETFSNDMAVCHADNVITIDLEPVEIPEATAGLLSKTPVLFVPGLMGTEIKKDNSLVWLEIGKMLLSQTDNFLDILSFQSSLLPSDDNLSLSNVIGKKIIPSHRDYDYTEGLIREFEAAGYRAEGAGGEQTFYSFPYDWRYGASGAYPVPENTGQRPITNVDLLADKIAELAQISPTGKVDVIAHSLGGLIAKKYALETGQPLIGKLVFLGVPNLGTPLAGRALLLGTDFGVFGLNPLELKKISQNMPAAYDLLPSREYFESKSGWINIYKPTNIFAINALEKLDYIQTRIYLGGAGMSNAAMRNAADFHSSDLDGDFVQQNFWARGIDSYNIAGCKAGTFSIIEDWQNQDGTHDRYDFGPLAAGDDTVIFESANQVLASDQKTFYAPKIKHGQMPSFANVKQKVVNIIAGNDNRPIEPGKIITKDQLRANPNLCALFGTTIKIESPIDIKITDQFGNVVELINGTDIKNQIPGANFEFIGDHKFVYLPNDGNEQYQIELIGAGAGFFTLTAQTIENNQPQTPRVFANLPVSESTRGNLVLGQEIILNLDQNNDGQIDQTIVQDGNLTIDDLLADFDRAVLAGLVLAPAQTEIREKLANLQTQLAVLEEHRQKPSGKSAAALAAAINRHIEQTIKMIAGFWQAGLVDRQSAARWAAGLAGLKLK